tara:strand:+ start:372 stop:701 length:330 start_codon:yes stop_codon:yes gene_type:complete
MCFFGGGGSNRPKVAKYESKNDPVVVEGQQEGVETTTKASDELKIQKEAEGRMANQDITTAQALTKKGSSGSAIARNMRSARLRSGVSRGPNKGGTAAQKAAAARRANR